MKAIPLAPRIAVAVDLQDETVIESDVARIHGTGHGVVHVGGFSAQSVRIAGTPDACVVSLTRSPKRLPSGDSRPKNVSGPGPNGANFAPLALRLLVTGDPRPRDPQRPFTFGLAGRCHARSIAPHDETD
jgi:hypothetical protein